MCNIILPGSLVNVVFFLQGVEWWDMLRTGSGGNNGCTFCILCCKYIHGHFDKRGVG